MRKKLPAVAVIGLLCVTTILSGCVERNRYKDTGKLYASSSDLNLSIRNKNVTNKHVHKYQMTNVVPTCLERGYMEYKCECGHSYKDEYAEKGACKWRYWIVTKYPTVTEEGEKSRECIVCGKIEKEVLDKIQITKKN